MRIIDISQELFAGAVYPGDTPPSFRRVAQLPQDPCNLTDITLCAHNGTHADAPRHFIADGAAIDAISLEVFYGPCVVAAFSGPVEADAVAPLLGCERLLIKGDAMITAGAARAIAGSQLKLLGVESQSVDPPDGPPTAHLLLLARGVVILEGLDLRQAPAGAYTLTALPLKLGGCDGAPVRAALIQA
ncbi:MAG: cyclase family protein [Peptococcaceae bacterium]|jgi:arylformamidase|nr:cyclase family protein [Peptococcaceae bacterium]